MQKASVVIIGGGVIGCSVAYHLAKLGIRDIVLLEKDFVASKATGICPGGIRQQWSSKIGCLLSQASVRFFEHLHDELSPTIPLQFVQTGYLFIAFTEEMLEGYRQNVRLQNELGIPSKILEPMEIKDLVTEINLEGVLGGAYCAQDGFLEDCYGFTNTLALRAKEMGVRIHYDRAKVIVLDGNRVCAIRCEKDDYACEAVVNAAGSESVALAATAGIELPIESVKRRLLFTQRIEDHFLVPCLVSLEKGWGGKQLQEGHIYMAYIGKGAEEMTDYEFIEKSTELGLAILPRLEDTGILRIQEGYYDMTPDGNPILGSVKGVEGYFQASGFSGHGFMLSPAIGRGMAELIAGQESSIDLSPWHLERFQGEVTEEGLIL